MSDRQQPPHERSDGFLRRTVTVVAVTAAFVAVGLLVWGALDIFLLVFASVLLATFLNAPASYVSERAPIPHAVTVVGVAILVAGLGVGIGFLAGPAIGQQATDLIGQLPDSIENLRERVRQLPGGASVLDRMASDEGGAEELLGAGVPGGGLVSRVTGTASKFWDAIAKLILVVSLGMYLAISPRTYRDGLASLVPPGRRERAIEVLNRIGRVLRGWLLGQLVAMVLVGLLTWLGLSLVGIPLALVLGLLAGLFEFVPIVGPFVAFVPAALLALTQGGSTVIWVIVVYVVIQQLEGNVIVPLIQRRTVSLPPALTIGAVFVAGAAFGPLGLLVATPLAAVGLVLFEMLYRHDLFGEHVELPAGGEE